MLVNGEYVRTIGWRGDTVAVIDQRALPHRYEWVHWTTVDDAAAGIADMTVRGAPLIGVTAAHGIALAMAAEPSDAALDAAIAMLAATRPTAVNLRWALDICLAELQPLPWSGRGAAARALAHRLADDDVAACHAIGTFGLALVRAAHDRNPDRPVRIMTHCNAGFLACVDWGTATAPVYLAHDAGIPVHVWVSETRPRNQGTALTAWELAAAHVPHTVIVDNAAGHVLAQGAADLVIVGADRVAANGDVANKIGTYLKALAAHANEVPFYVAAPVSSIDPDCPDGSMIPIEERSPDEVRELSGVRLTPAGSPARNWGFDVTPARYVDGLITERGMVEASLDGVASLWP